MNDAKWWTAASMTTVNGLVSAGYSVAGLVTAGGPAHLLAMYAAARSVPLALAVLFHVARRASPEVAALALVLGFVQASDALVGVASHDASKTIGPAVFAVLTLASRPWLRASGRSLTSASRTPA